MSGKLFRSLKFSENLIQLELNIVENHIDFQYQKLSKVLLLGVNKM